LCAKATKGAARTRRRRRSQGRVARVYRSGFEPNMHAMAEQQVCSLAITQGLRDPRSGERSLVEALACLLEERRDGLHATDGRANAIVDWRKVADHQRDDGEHRF